MATRKNAGLQGAIKGQEDKHLFVLAMVEGKDVKNQGVTKGRKAELPTASLMAAGGGVIILDA